MICGKYPDFTLGVSVIGKELTRASPCDSKTQCRAALNLARAIQPVQSIETGDQQKYDL